MQSVKEEILKNKKVIFNWLAHHNPKREDFNDHVLYIFNYAVCLGCFAFFLGVIIALIIGNIFYPFFVKFVSLPIIFLVFLLCWIPSIFQYTIQIARKKPLRNRTIKFLIRFLYPIGSILFIFRSPIWGFGLSIPAGYLIIYIRKMKKKRFSEP
ncbi:MAG: hypothetical protein JSV62_12820 [Promethearchaeota archaeon]|nr:MAG: hypothetical protein JSV62_12820 [Candidatus Lokiarchaeota archaeon]